MGALKNFESPDYAHRYFSRNLAYVPIDTKNVHTKFEVRSFTRSWDNTVKLLSVPGYANAPFSPKFLKGFCSD